MTSFVTHLQSALDPSVTLPARTIQTIHEGRPLWVRYDLARIRAAVTRQQVATREPTLWRYRELLPLDDDQALTTLGEGMTPLLPAPRLAAKLGLKHLIIKDESLLPTGSFKSRGMAVAVSMARQLGIKRVAIPTAGNAGGSLAAYAARAGMECFVFMPEDTPAVNRAEAALYGAHAFGVNGLITDCGAIVREGAQRMGWFDFSTLKEPYRLEGKKTMGLELAEQLGWKLPDAIFYPTGGGTGLIGMWKAFAELKELDWLASPKLPRLFSCQSSGCAPIVNAFDKGQRFAEPPPNPHTLASGLRVPKAVGDFMILDAVRESKGAAIAAEESRLTEWMHLATRLEGISLCPEAAACIGAIQAALARGLLSPDESVVIFNTGAAQKYLEVIDRPLPSIDCRNIDWASIEQLGRS
jgi:threonine synthase